MAKGTGQRTSAFSPANIIAGSVHHGSPSDAIQRQGGGCLFAAPWVLQRRDGVRDRPCLEDGSWGTVKEASDEPGEGRDRVVADESTGNSDGDRAADEFGENSDGGAASEDGDESADV
jgi:hypothetical protein